jgi:hypothetical protein
VARGINRVCACFALVNLYLRRKCLASHTQELRLKLAKQAEEPLKTANTNDSAASPQPKSAQTHPLSKMSACAELPYISVEYLQSLARSDIRINGCGPCRFHGINSMRIHIPATTYQPLLLA